MTWRLCIALAVVAAACAEAAVPTTRRTEPAAGPTTVATAPAEAVGTTLATPATTTPATTTLPTSIQPTATLPESASLREAIDRATADLAKRLDVGVGSIGVVSATERSWPDASLGCPQPGQVYAQAVTVGFEVVLDYTAVEYVYRGTDESALTLCVTLLTLNPSGLSKLPLPFGSEQIAVDPGSPCAPQQLDRVDADSGLVPAQQYMALDDDGLIHRYVVVESETYDCGVTVGLTPPLQP